MALFKRKAPSSKGSDFYHRENLLQNIKDLNHYLGAVSTHQTEVPIRYMGIDPGEITMKWMEKNIGTDWTHFDHEEMINGHEVYFYRRKASGISMLIQFHYLKDRFIMVATKFYADYLLTDKDKQTILAKLHERYADAAVASEATAFSLTDNSGNMLQTVDNVFCYIIYVPASAIKRTDGKVHINASRPGSDSLTELI